MDAISNDRPSLQDSWRKVGTRFDAEEAAQTAAPEPTQPEPATDAIGRTLRHDGWTPERQRTFLSAIAQGCTITAACRRVGLTPASAYALRDRAAGSAFALGWSAANLRAREPLADGLIARALDGQIEQTTRPNGDIVERFRYDNGLATRLLARLDRQAEAQGPNQQAAARLVASEFESFLDLIGRDGGPARAGLFLSARAGRTDDLEAVRALARADRFARAGGGLAQEVDVADLDLAARAGWTAEQWVRAEAAGLLRIAPEAPETAFGQQEGQLVPDFVDAPVWWDEVKEDWRTSFPPPADFDGDDNGATLDGDYERELTPDEWDVVQRHDQRAEAEDQAIAAAERDRWFAAAVAELAATGQETMDGAEDDARDACHGVIVDAGARPVIKPIPDCPDDGPTTRSELLYGEVSWQTILGKVMEAPPVRPLSREGGGLV